MNQINIRISFLVALAGLSMLFFSCSKSSSNVPPANEVYIEGLAFFPSTLTVTKGTTVKWTNKDNTTHTVTSDNPLFDSGDKVLDQTFSYTFDSIDTYNYHCNKHSGMTGSVIVH